MVVVGTVNFDRVASDRVVYDWSWLYASLDKAVQLWAETHNRAHDARSIPRRGRLSTRTSPRRHRDARL